MPQQSRELRAKSPESPIKADEFYSNCINGVDDSFLLIYKLEEDSRELQYRAKVIKGYGTTLLALSMCQTLIIGLIGTFVLTHNTTLLPSLFLVSFCLLVPIPGLVFHIVENKRHGNSIFALLVSSLHAYTVFKPQSSSSYYAKNCEDRIKIFLKSWNDVERHPLFYGWITVTFCVLINAVAVLLPIASIIFVASGQ